MSRIGKKILIIPAGVTITQDANGGLTVKGPKGELKRIIHPNIKIEINGSEVAVKRQSNSKTDRSLHGLVRSLVNNMVIGVTKGFEKRLEIIGVGFRAQPAKNKITLSLGFSHPIEHVAPAGIEFKMDEEKKNVIIITGMDKQIVGEVAANIREYKKPEPYKGKGIKYEDERIIRKAGKSAAGSSAGAK